MTQNLSTMRPLLTRLRDRPKDHLLLHEAADEIERLRAALTYAWQTEGGVRKEDDALYDELCGAAETPVKHE